MNKAVVKYIKNDATVLEKDLLEELARKGQLMAYNHEGYWRCVDTVRELDLVNKEFETGQAPWVKW
jgi:glucose-1-phosphate cytidylyltransferase